MAGRLKLPEPVLSPLAAAVKSLPEGLPIEELTEPETVTAAWKTATTQLPTWQEDDGIAQLAVMLAAVCQTEKRYSRGIYKEIFEQNNVLYKFHTFSGSFDLSRHEAGGIFRG